MNSSPLAIPQPCIFCDILNGKNDQKPIYEDELCFAFDDISKDSAREHILVCPREHIKNVNSLNSSHTELLIHMKKVAEDLLNKIDSKAEKRYFLITFLSINILPDMDSMSLLFIQLNICICMWSLARSRASSIEMSPLVDFLEELILKLKW